MDLYHLSKFEESSILNPRLHQRIVENIEKDEERQPRGVGGRRTCWNFHTKGIKEVDIILNWIRDVTPEASKAFVNPEGYVYHDPFSFRLVECWGLDYEEGEELRVHNHFPYTLSFVYCVNSPEGSSPLIIEMKEVFLNEGECVFFPSYLFHYVKRTPKGGRCVLVGNILYVHK